MWSEADKLQQWVSHHVLQDQQTGKTCDVGKREELVTHSRVPVEAMTHEHQPCKPRKGSAEPQVRLLTCFACIT